MRGGGCGPPGRRGAYSAQSEADWSLYVPVHRDPVTGIVLAEAQVTFLRRR
ncbi:hypothetical protein GCM10010272_69340 [Streptomyces lateritius]|nr:hypothetical protein GCM10010272_69340 [Streptomyces lateritius]